MTAVESHLAERFEQAERRARRSQVLSLAMFAAAIIAGIVLAYLSLLAKRDLDSLQRQHDLLVQQNADIRSQNAGLQKTQSALQTSVEDLTKQRRLQEDSLRALAAIQNERVLGPQPDAAPASDHLTEKAKADLAAAGLQARLRKVNDKGTVVVLGTFREISNARNTSQQLRASLFPGASVRLTNNGYYAVVTDAAVAPKQTLAQARTNVSDAYLYDKGHLPVEVQF